MNKIYNILTNGEGIHRKTQGTSISNITKRKIRLLIPETNIEYMSYQAEQLIQLLMSIDSKRVYAIDSDNLYKQPTEFPITTSSTIFGDISDQISVVLTNGTQLSGEHNILITSNTISINGIVQNYTTTDNLSNLITISPGVSILIKNSSTITGTHNIKLTYQLPFKNSLIDTYNRVYSLISTNTFGSIPEKLSKLLFTILEDNV